MAARKKKPDTKLSPGVAEALEQEAKLREQKELTHEELKKAHAELQQQHQLALAIIRRTGAGLATQGGELLKLVGVG